VAEYAMASAELQEEIAMTLADIQEMYTEAEMRLRNVQLYEDRILPQTRALAESSREAYPAGMIPAMEMLDAQNMLLEAEMNYQKERAAYATAHAKLMAIAQPWTADEVATGLPLHGGEEQ
jgi:outer membrane protein TolC